MTSTARDTRALEAYVQWSEQTGRSKPREQFSAFQGGYLAALESARPLIEAARAYREALARFVALPDSIVCWESWNRAEMALVNAARTFEGHVEEDANAAPPRD